MNINGKDIADNIRAERNRARMSQGQVAELLGITSRTYGSYEQDAKNLKATTIYKLSIIFKCNINDFYIK